jgi:Mn-dependent DtxR family transcriptional regulator
MQSRRVHSVSIRPLDCARIQSVSVAPKATEILMPKRKAKSAPRYAEQPAVAAILKLLRNPRGATVAEIAKARGLQPHTVRSVLSRLGSKGGLVLTRTKVEGRGGLEYRAGARATAARSSGR